MDRYGAYKAMEYKFKKIIDFKMLYNPQHPERIWIDNNPTLNAIARLNGVNTISIIVNVNSREEEKLAIKDSWITFIEKHHKRLKYKLMGYQFKENSLKYSTSQAANWLFAAQREYHDTHKSD